MFKPLSASLPNGQRVQPLPDDAINSVFKVLHGFYGNLFFSKFATGQVENGEDQGIANARRIWAHGLRDFDADTIRTALRHCQDRHPEFPPSMPQFAALCAAAKPREGFKPGKPSIGMSQKLRSRYAAQARAINARYLEKKLEQKAGYVELPATLDGLKQAIASAISCAGGNEAETLLRLDRDLAPRRAA
jgi:hypothetical protein